MGFKGQWSFRATIMRWKRNAPSEGNECGTEHEANSSHSAAGRKHPFLKRMPSLSARALAMP